MEALSWRSGDPPGPIRALPPDQGGYLAQPDMRRLMTTALELGWSLWAYEAQFKITADTDPAEFLTMDFTNWREREQARNLCRLQSAARGEPLLVWCGNGHASKERDEWIPMGWHFRAMSGTDPFVIDQTVSITFEGPPKPWVEGLLASLAETLAAHGGTTGILREQAPAPLNSRTDVDAVVVSTENTLSPDIAEAP
jgi:hypothetical protein